ncbi:Hypothetical protein D9617_49g041220 [Elsinoe fawcettii]|nr:Hypothetical protein D9617_49g041220 [Elsinoe fawcettii]
MASVPGYIAVWEERSRSYQIPYSHNRMLKLAQDSDKFAELLTALHDVQTNEPALSMDARYTVRFRRAYTAARQKRLEEYTGPDETTEQLLQANGDDWLADAAKFLRPMDRAAPSSVSCHVLINIVQD